VEGQAGTLAQVPCRRRRVADGGGRHRKALRRATGQIIETAEITRLLRETVIRTDCLP